MGKLSLSPAAMDSMAGWFASQYDDLRRFGFVLSGDWSIADDLVQEAFVRICSRPRRVEREGFPAYARRTMVNLWRTALVRIRLERRHATDGDRLTAPDSGSVAGNDQVWQAVMALSPQQRAVVALRYYEDMSEADIAAVLGVSLGAVKKQLNRAKEKMRATLGEGERHGS